MNVCDMVKSDSEVFHFETKYDDRPVSEQTVNEVLQSRAEQLGDDPLVFYGPEDRAVSYAQMYEVANAVGNSLADLGVEKGDKVSVMMQDPSGRCRPSSASSGRARCTARSTSSTRGTCWLTSRRHRPRHPGH